MRLPSVVAALAIVGSLQPTALTAQDTVILTNGDRLTGQLTEIVGRTWVLKHAGGELKLAAADVVSYASDREIGVRLQDGTLAAGRVALLGDRMQFIAADGTTRTIAPGDLAAVGSPANLDALREIHIGFLSPIARFWGASIGAGFASKSGNSQSRGYNGDLKISRSTAKDRLAFGLGAVGQWAPDATDALAKIVEKYYGSGRLDVFVSSAIYMFAGTLQEIDKFQGLDLRSNYSGGAGYQVLSTGLTDLRFDLSGGLRVENFTPAAGDSTTSTPIWSAGSQLRQKLGPVVFDWTGRWTPAVDDLKDYRFLSEAGLSTTIFKGLGFRIGSRNEYNNNPPVGVKKHDWLFTTNLTYTLGG